MRASRWLLAVVTSTAVALIGAGVWIARAESSTLPTPHDRQHLAADILDHWRTPMTMPALKTLQRDAGAQEHANSDNRNFANAPVSSGGTGGPPRSFTNVRVNDPRQDIHQTDQTTQSETSIAVTGSHVVVGFNDSQQALLAFTAATDFSGYGYSSDGGSTFTDGGTIPNASNFANVGDPWLASDRAGNVYYSTLASGGDVGNLEVVVAKSTDGGKTFGTPVFASPHNDNLLYLADKDALTVGPAPTNKASDVLYDTWDDTSCDPTTSTCSNGLPVARSLDGGQTWTMTYADQVTADPSSCSFTQYLGAQPVVDARTGTLYVAAEKYNVNDPNCTGTQPLTVSEWIFTSTDAGQTFAPGVKIADITPATPTGALNLGNGAFMRTAEFPTLAVSAGNLYAAWNDGSSGNSHIRLAKSSDGGNTWATSWLTHGSNDEIQPALSADKAGLHALYYQRNSDNTLDVVVANSKNGNGWVASRVTSTSFPGVVTVPQFDPVIAFGYMGDYIANVTDGSHEYFAWGDNRDTIMDFTFPHGRHDPDVFFAKG
jgi:hypothetical protein